MNELTCKIEKYKYRKTSYYIFSNHAIFKENKEVEISVDWNKITISKVNIDSLNIRTVYKDKRCERYSFGFASNEDIEIGFYDITEIDEDTIEVVFIKESNE